MKENQEDGIMVCRVIKPDGRDVKRFIPTCGIYAIVHVSSSRRYGGSSIEIEKRLYHHLIQLRVGTHSSPYLQNLWNKHGEQEFQFLLLEICDAGVLAQREQFFMDETVELLNVQPAARTALGYRHTIETKKKQSESAKLRATSPTERQLRSERAKKQHASGNLGAKTWTEDGRRRVQEASKRGLAIGGAKGRELAHQSMTSEEMSRRSYFRKLFKEK